MTADEYEATTIEAALAGDHDAGREALRLCREGLDHGTLSRRLAEYLAERLWRIDKALDESEKIRQVKKSSGSARSVRDAAIAEALCIKRPEGRPADSLPEWQVPYAAFGTRLLKEGYPPERVKSLMDDARRQIEGKDAGLDRREAEKILKAYQPMSAMDDEGLMHHAKALREILSTYLPQAKKR